MRPTARSARSCSSPSIFGAHQHPERRQLDAARPGDARLPRRPRPPPRLQRRDGGAPRPLAAAGPDPLTTAGVPVPGRCRWGFRNAQDPRLARRHPGPRPHLRWTPARSRPRHRRLRGAQRRGPRGRPRRAAPRPQPRRRLGAALRPPRRPGPRPALSAPQRHRRGSRQRRPRPRRRPRRRGPVGRPPRRFDRAPRPVATSRRGQRRGAIRHAAIGRRHRRRQRPRRGLRAPLRRRRRAGLDPRRRRRARGRRRRRHRRRGALRGRASTSPTTPRSRPAPRASRAETGAPDVLVTSAGILEHGEHRARCRHGAARPGLGGELPRHRRHRPRLRPADARRAAAAPIVTLGSTNSFVRLPAAGLRAGQGRDPRG